MNYRKFKKNAKGLSPVVASIILIAVTVAVSVVVAAWMGGMTIGLMGNAEQAKISGTTYVDDKSVTVTLQNTGSAPVIISSATIDGNAATMWNGASQVQSFTVAKGTTATLTIAYAGNETFTSTAQYTIALQTAKGNTITYAYTYTGQ